MRARRRVSKELARLCGIEPAPYDHEHDCVCADHWHDVGMDLGVRQREIAGEEL